MPDTATKPRIVCLCGSMRYGDQMRDTAVRESLWGHIVLAPHVDMRKPDPRWSTPEYAETIKAHLDELHFRKIDLADEVVVVRVNGYVGESTRNEIDYAASVNTPVRYTDYATAEAASPVPPGSAVVTLHAWPAGGIVLADASVTLLAAHAGNPERLQVDGWLGEQMCPVFYRDGATVTVALPGGRTISDAQVLSVFGSSWRIKHYGDERGGHLRFWVDARYAEAAGVTG